MPLPIETELRVHDSPVPTQIVFGSDGAMAIAPIDWTGCLSKTGLKVVPPSDDFHTPPLAAPTYNVVFPPSFRPAIAEIRPLIVAEPMFRPPRPEITPESSIRARGLLADGGGCAKLGAGACRSGRTLRITLVPLGGNRKKASSTSMFASACSTVKWAALGSPLRPDSKEKGIHTPATSHSCRNRSRS